jgi:sugar lactone lactonase YvrE
MLACFVNLKGADTLLICDYGNHRIVEVTASGVFLRAIAVTAGSDVYGIAQRGGVIAVSLHAAHSVVLLQYESGTVMPEVTIGSGTFGRGDGQLWRPAGVSFTADGRYILVADYGNHRVSRFSAASGAFIAHVATKEANGIYCPRDVLQCEDGSIVVAQGAYGGNGSVVYVGEDGVTVKNIIIPSASDVTFTPHSLSYSPSWNGVVVKTLDGNVFLLRDTCDAWMSSNRCAWLSALTCF